MATEVTIYETVNQVTVLEDVTDVSISEEVVNVTVDQSTAETTVTISNEQGPQGPIGPAGPQGATGATGATGPQGIPGVIQSITNIDGTIAVSGSVSNVILSVPNYAVYAANSLNSDSVPAAGIVGTILPAQISGVALLSSANTFTAKNTFGGVGLTNPVMNFYSLGPTAPTSPAVGDLWTQGTSSQSLFFRSTSSTSQTVAWADASNISNVAKLNVSNTWSTGNQRIDGTYGSFKVDSQGLTVLGQNASAMGAWLNVTAYAATDKLAVLRGAASQTGNFMELQNSAGSVLGYISSAAVMRMSILQGGSGAETDLRSANSGGLITMTRATAAATNPGTNFARLYFRDGTNAGTLKLVVRAGTAGAETTILDNIPQ